MTLTVSLNGLIDAVMEADSKFYAFVYRDNGNGRAYPVRCEVTEWQYRDYIRTLDIEYRDADYVTFNIEAQKAEREDAEHAEWLAELDNQDLERQDLWR
jgi:hypothetical protein